VILFPASSPAQTSGPRTSPRKTISQPKKASRTEEPWEEIPFLLDRPERKYLVVALVSAPQIFIWDPEDAMKELMQKQAWKIKADAIILDRVNSSFRFTGPCGGANGRATLYQ